MIILITGLPGSGKSLYTVTVLPKRFEGRTIHQTGIDGLTLPWVRFDDVEQWQTLPPGSVLVIDEAQLKMPLRPATQQPPAWIEQLTKHRHLGLDIVLITQHPNLIDSYVRRLVGEHIHLHRALGFQRATTYTWDSYHEAFLMKSRKSIARVGTFNYPASSFGLYKSAEVHTVKRVIPKVAYVFAGAVALVIGGVYMTYRHYASIGGTQTASPGQQGFQPVANRGNQSDPAGLGSVRAQIDKLSLPWRREEYAKLTEPKRAPVPHGCVVRAKSTGDDCVCYTVDATIIRDTPQSYCRDFVAGYIFQDWRDPEKEKERSEASTKRDLMTGREAPVQIARQATDTAPFTEPMKITPGAPVTGWRSSDWAIAPKYQ